MTWEVNMDGTTILSIILFLISILFIGYIVFSIYFYRKKVVEWNHVIAQYMEALNDKPKMSMGERISATHSLFQLIDTLIEYEIVSDREYEVLLQKKSKRLNIEEEVQKISKSVFEELKPDAYTDVNNIVTSKCLMSYIQKRTFVEYFLYLQKTNVDG